MTLIGFLAFLLIFSFLIFIHELGHFLAARKSGVKVEEFGMGMGKKLWGKKIGETEYTINLIPFGGFVRMLGEEQKSKDPRSFGQAALWKKMIITLAGIFMNFLFAVVALTIIFFLGSTPFLTSEQDVRQAYRDGAVSFQTKTGKIIPLEQALESRNQKEIRAVYDQEKLKKPIHEAFFTAVKKTSELSVMIVRRVAKLPGEIIREKKIPDDIGGPVRIASIVNESVPQGFWFLFKIAILLSISLAVMNLLPIPALDGGRFLFQVVELFLLPFHKKPSQKIEMAVHLAGFMMLMLFMIAVTIRDVIQTDWF